MLTETLIIIFSVLLLKCSAKFRMISMSSAIPLDFVCVRAHLQISLLHPHFQDQREINCCILIVGCVKLL